MKSKITWDNTIINLKCLTFGKNLLICAKLDITYFAVSAPHNFKIITVPPVYHHPPSRHTITSRPSSTLQTITISSDHHFHSITLSSDHHQLARPSLPQYHPIVSPSLPDHHQLFTPSLPQHHPLVRPSFP